MTETGPARRRARQVVTAGLVITVYFSIVLFLQWKSGAYGQTFGSQSDEAAHYVTALMIRDYAVSGFPGNPVSFARDYYNYYPKVAFGAWPPLFHFANAAWMLVFGDSRAAALLFMAALTTLLAYLLFVEARGAFGFWPALTAGVYTAALPLTQDCTSPLLPDTLVTVMVFGFGASFWRYLERPSPRDAAVAGLLGGLALAAKPNALALFIAVPLALLLARKWALLRARSFWLAAALALVIGIPAEVMPFVQAGERGESLNTVPAALASLAVYFEIILGNLGWSVVVLALVGLAGSLEPGIRGAVAARWSVYAALAAGCLVFHSALTGEAKTRYILPLVPLAALFALAGAERLGGMLPGRRASAAALAIWLAALAPPAWSFFIPRKHSPDLTPIVREVAERTDSAAPVVLVASGSIGEGVVISEFARLDERPRHRVIRATKALAESDWNGTFFRPRYESAEELAGFLESEGIESIILDRGTSELPGNIKQLLVCAMEGRYSLQMADRETNFELYYKESGQ